MVDKFTVLYVIILRAYLRSIIIVRVPETLIGNIV